MTNRFTYVKRVEWFRQILVRKPSILIILALLILPSAGHAQFNILSLAPPSHSLTHRPGDPIEITFDRPLNAASISDASVKISGNLHGNYGFDFQYISGENRLRLWPRPGFIPGEQIAVYLSQNLQAENGSRLEAGFEMQFQVSVPLGNLPGGEYKSSLFLIPESKHQNIKLLVGDFDKDHFPDVAVINSDQNTLSIWENRTPERLEAYIIYRYSYPTGNMPLDGLVADLDDDGDLDIAVVNFGDNSVSIFWGTNGTEFSATTTLPVGFRPAGITGIDYNLDGRIDLAVALLGEDRVALVQNQGNRSLTVDTYLAAGKGTNLVAASDFNLDGKPDLAAANSSSRDIYFYFNQSPGGWETRISAPLNKRPLAMGWWNLYPSVNDLPPLPELAVLTSDVTILGKPGATNQTEIDFLGITNLNNPPELLDNRNYPGVLQTFAFGNMDPDLEGEALDSFPDLDLISGDYYRDVLQYLENLGGGLWAENFSSIITTRITSSGEEIQGIDSLATPRNIVIADFNRDGANDVLTLGHFSAYMLLISSDYKFPCQCGKTVIDFGDVFVTLTDTFPLSITPLTSLDFTLFSSVADTVNFGVEPTELPILNGQNNTLNVMFSPTDTLYFQSELFINSNLSSQDEPIVIELRGHGIATEISTRPDTLDFGNVPPDSTRTLELTIFNGGNTELRIDSLRNYLPNFRLPTHSSFVIPAFDSTIVLVSFTPNTLDEYTDTLIIYSSDLQNPRLPVVMKGRGANAKPIITSPDSITVVEHQYFSYLATAEDPDDNPVEIFFQHLSPWMKVDGDSVFGVPPEGAKDTYFFVIANDGFYYDTLRVKVGVVPVNDPPVVEPITPFTYYERDQITITVRANDPENEPLRLRAQNLPAEATFIDHGDNSGTFSWQPLFRSAGTYTIPIIAQETQSRPALADTAQLVLTIKRLEPDLVVENLEISREEIRLNQTATVTVLVQNYVAPVLETFRVELRIGSRLLADSVIHGMEKDSEFLFRKEVVFNQLGHIEIRFAADADNIVREQNEGNNYASQTILIEKGRLIVRPNPFTPNNDMKNDRAIFDMNELAVRNPRLFIFDFNGRRIRSITEHQDNIMVWDGRDETSKEQPPGVYLYLLKDGDQNVAQGYIVLAR